MSKKILIVEDEPHIAKMLERRLNASGYATVNANNAVKAVEQAKLEKPDLILLDFKMPSGDGLGVIEKLKKMPETIAIPVIFLTASAERDTEKRAYELGAKYFMTKPFKAEELLEKIQSVLGNG